MHHNDAPDLDPRTDITDLYAFQKPGDPAISILILNVNPEAPAHADAFDPRASYELKIDTNGDFKADIAFHVLFSPLAGGQQAATVYRASGAAATKPARKPTALHPRMLATAGKGSRSTVREPSGCRTTTDTSESKR